MKVLSLMGSPKKHGNSAFASSKVIEFFKSHGYDTEEVYLKNLEIGGCIACQQCRKAGKCVIKDDFPELLEKVQESDIFAIAAPIYFGRVPGPVKNFIDRCYSLFDDNFKSKIRPGKKCLFITVSHAPAEAFADEVNYLEKWFVDFMKFTVAEKIAIGKCADPGDLAAREEDVRKIEEACKKLGNI